MEESACWQGIKLPAAAGQREVDSWTVAETKHESGGSGGKAYYLTRRTIARSEHNVASRRHWRGGGSHEDPLWWREGTEGQGLRGTPASPRERVNILLI